jgi:hypothetical protein
VFVRSGPTIVLGCSAPPYNPLRQVLNAVGAGDAVEWLRYDGWGMVVPLNEAQNSSDAQRPGQWRLQLGPGHFEAGPLAAFGGPAALHEFRGLRDACGPLVAGAVGIPAMSMRGGALSLLPLLRHWDELKVLAGQGTLATGDFSPFLNGPNFVVTDPWLRAWLDALAFSLSGLPAAQVNRRPSGGSKSVYGSSATFYYFSISRASMPTAHCTSGFTPRT